MLTELLLLDHQELYLESCQIMEGGVNIAITAQQKNANCPQ